MWHINYGTDVSPESVMRDEADVFSLLSITKPCSISVLLSLVENASSGDWWLATLLLFQFPLLQMCQNPLLHIITTNSCTLHLSPSNIFHHRPLLFHFLLILLTIRSFFLTLPRTYLPFQLSFMLPSSLVGKVATL